MCGFLLTAVMIPLACLPADPWVSVAWFCGAVFGLELTVGVSWAITLDLGGDYAGSVSAVMNTLGNLGAAAAAALTGYLATEYGWSAAFLVLAGLALIAAGVCSQIDASRKLNLNMPLTGEPLATPAE